MSQASISPQFALAILQAAKKGIDAKVAREETGPGVYRNIVMDVHIEVDEMRVAPDTDRAPTASIPLLPTCALLLKRMGVQRDQALEVLKDVMTQALDMGKDATKSLLEETGVADMEKRLKEEVINKLPRVETKGAVKVDKDAVRVTLQSMSMDRD
jgi:hypothetical protein